MFETMTIARELRTLTAAAILTALPAVAALAQTTQSPEAVERIVGSDVEEEQVNAAAEPERLVGAIDRTAENIEIVRKTSALDKIDIVFLPDASLVEGGPPPEVEAKVEDNRAAINELRKEIESNAMIYHAINSRQILPRDILAVEFEKPARMVIYAAAKPPGN